MLSYSVISNSLRPHALLPTGLLCPWDSPGKNIEWVVILFSRGSSWPMIEPTSPARQVDSLPLSHLKFPHMEYGNRRRRRCGFFKRDNRTFAICKIHIRTGSYLPIHPHPASSELRWVFSNTGIVRMVDYSSLHAEDLFHTIKVWNPHTDLNRTRRRRRISGARNIFPEFLLRSRFGNI